MKTYIGFYFPKKTAEIERLITKVDKESNVATYDSESLFLASNEELQNSDNYFSNDEYVLLFAGDCFNKEELIAKVTHEGELNFAEALVTLYKLSNETVFKHIRGNFTLLLYDKINEQIFVIRDQFGTNLLFYKQIEDGLIFANTKKQISNLLNENVVNTEALQHYLSFQYVPDPLTLTKQIHIVPAGNYVKINENKQLFVETYYERTFHPIVTEKHYWINRIRDALYDSVSAMMEGENSIGSFLSGGIDSSLIASIAKEIKPDIKTFSVGFEREGYSEIDVARETADELQLENISKVITAEEYVDSLREIMWNMDDPLADPACVPLYFVAKEAKKHVNSALSGEGADEFFGGYNIYREPESLKLFSYIPSIIKDSVRNFATILPERMKGKNFLERGTTPLRERYIGNAKIFEEKEKKLIFNQFNDNISYHQITAPFFEQVQDEPLTTQMQFIDIHTWLPGDILLKAQKMSSANRLKVRMPFVDINVFEVARELPVHLMIANKTTKHILREAARGIVPNHVLDRKKLGFPVPIRHWLKDELYDWAKTLITKSETDEFINKQQVLHLLELHVQGKEDLSRKLWTLLMFMLWYQIFVEEK